ncbi:MAG: radical SAM protein [Oscillospiraceae bacterium]|nr:radical SAM protein [Oscillospiraceae bacterium]
MNIQHKPVKTVITKSKLPASDYAVNPYVGCPHKCVYCYACFMKRFTGHEEPWGEFIDIKAFPPIKNPSQYDGKTLFFGSVTDCYNPYEAEYQKTREILEQFMGTEAEITLATKSNLIVRDLEILKQIKHLTVAFSINTVDENFRRDMDQAAGVKERIKAMKLLHENGIHTVTFLSPIFPGITSVEKIVEATRDYCNAYWLENLNLRGSYRPIIMDYINRKYPQLMPLYEAIYEQGDKGYWIALSEQLDAYAQAENLNMVNYFYHELIRKK